MDDEKAQTLAKSRARLADGYLRTTPHGHALGAEVVELGHGLAVFRLPFRHEFTGDVDAGLWHTSVGLSLIDNTCGLSVLNALPGIEPIATLDLRTDYLRPAVIPQPLIARAECYHVTRHIAFVRGEVYQETRDRLAAHFSAAFMRTSKKINVPDDNRPGERV